MDSRGDDVEEEATGRYHVTDYAHVYESEWKYQTRVRVKSKQARNS